MELLTQVIPCHCPDCARGMVAQVNSWNGVVNSELASAGEIRIVYDPSHIDSKAILEKLNTLATLLVGCPCGLNANSRNLALTAPHEENFAVLTPSQTVYLRTNRMAPQQTKSIPLLLPNGDQSVFPGAGQSNSRAVGKGQGRNVV